ncbi:hypothetical protein CYY_003825 [Polysphondylium violaceum]|uniref:Pentatricopeptide repeat-containing protein n=1 Tax=Polysphondylium violaceum TaxID=133409 RepID=A0A8J4PX51_9MYCE|nr:hypothetical protein CYY_003825 [Polysphondylium violaceum]
MNQLFQSKVYKTTTSLFRVAFTSGSSSGMGSSRLYCNTSLPHSTSEKEDSNTTTEINVSTTKQGSVNENAIYLYPSQLWIKDKVLSSNSNNNDNNSKNSNSYNKEFFVSRNSISFLPEILFPLEPTPPNFHRSNPISEENISVKTEFEHQEYNDILDIITNGNQVQRPLLVNDLEKAYNIDRNKTHFIFETDLVAREYTGKQVNDIYQWIKNTQHFNQPSVLNTFLQYYAGNTLDNVEFESLLSRHKAKEIQFDCVSFSIILNHFCEKQDLESLNYWTKVAMETCKKEMIENRLLGIALVRAYLTLSDIDSAVNILKLFKDSKSTILNHICYRSLHLFVHHLTPRKMYDKLLTIIKTHVAHSPSFLFDGIFYKLLIELWKNEYSVDDLFKYLEKTALFKAEVFYSEFIYYLLGKDQIDIAQSVHSMYLETHKPSFRIYNVLMNHLIKQDDYRSCLNLVKQMESHKLQLEPKTIVAILEMLERNNKTDLMNGFIKYLYSCPSFWIKMSLVIIHSEIYSNDLVFNKLVDRIHKLQMKEQSILINNIIRDCLKLGHYHSALRWYGVRLNEFRLKPNKYTLDFFRFYHEAAIKKLENTKNSAELIEKEKALINFWNSRYQHFDFVRAADETKAQEEYNNLRVLEMIKGIDQLTPMGLLKSQAMKYTPNFLALKQPTQEMESIRKDFIKQNTLLNGIKDTNLETSLSVFSQNPDNQANLNDLCRQLLEYIKKDTLPFGTVFLQAMVEILSKAPDRYISLLKKCSPNIRSALFDIEFYCDLIKKDVSTATSLLFQENPLFWRESDPIWNCLIISLYAAGRSDRAAKMIDTAKETNRVLDEVKIQECKDNPVWAPMSSEALDFITYNFIKLPLKKKLQNKKKD